jgi:hypothetical protein
MTCFVSLVIFVSFVAAPPAREQQLITELPV